MANVNRREFLKVLSAGTCGSLIHSALRPASGMMAFAMPPIVGALGPNTAMIVLNFAGGADQHTMSCLYDGWWMDLNPTLAYTPQASLPLNSQQGLHPSLTALKALYDEGSFAMVNMVGMLNNGVPTYTRAHDLDTASKLSGYPSGSSAYGGWAPRLTAQMSSGLGGVSFSGESLVSQGDTNPPRAIGDLDNFGEDGFFWGDLTNWFRNSRDNLLLSADPPAAPKHKGVRDSIVQVDTIARSLKEQTSTTLPVNFPGTSLGNNFKDIAKIIHANLGTQFFYVDQGGYDTHSGAKNAVTNNLNEVNGALQAFVQCAKVQGFWNRVVILTLSEFGRTIENGSQGDDHGFANSMWVLGGGIRGGRIIGPAPTRNDLGSRSYIGTCSIDFRQVFKECITAMGYNSNLVFPQPISFTPTGIFT